jgi:ubiquinol-cytochrome c reductase cytochrome c1 subunit
MTKRAFISIVMTLALLLGATSAQAFAEGGGELMPAHTNIKDKASLQRGARLFYNYCSGCHSLHFMRYSRMAKDLGLTKKEVMNNLNFTGAKFQGHAIAAMPEDDAAKWFGKAPPDLSLMVAEKGPDYVYSYLNSFYLDPSRPVGWNNTVFPNASMPNPLWELQGLQVPVMSKPDKDGKRTVTGVKLAQPGSMTPAQFHQATRDLTTFLQYVSEPAALQRHAYGIWVLLYLAAFTFLAYLLKHEYWKDVH